MAGRLKGCSLGLNSSNICLFICLNSDGLQYQGSGVHTAEGAAVATEAVESHGRPQSLNLTLPPLATVWLYLDKA